MSTQSSVSLRAVRAVTALPQPLNQALATARAHIVAELFAAHRVLPEPAAVFEPSRPVADVSAYGPLAGRVVPANGRSLAVARRVAGLLLGLALLLGMTQRLARPVIDPGPTYLPPPGLSLSAR